MSYLRSEKRLENLAGEAPAVIRCAIADYLRTHRNWYFRSSIWHARCVNYGSVLIIAFGAIASISAAYKTDELSPWPKFWFHTATIVLPAASSLIATILVQFKMRDVWRLRELGRIEAEMLITRALEITDNTTAYSEAIKLRQAAHDLEHRQLGEFFGESSVAGLRPPIADPQTS